MTTNQIKSAFVDKDLYKSIEDNNLPTKITPANRDELGEVIMKVLNSYDESKLSEEELNNPLRRFSDALSGGSASLVGLPYLNDKINKLDTTDLKNLATKALIGGVLGGGVSALGTEKQQPNETRQQRRQRLIRNALLGIAGGAGLGALSEVKMASQTKTAFTDKLKEVTGNLQDTVKNIDLTDPRVMAGLGSAGVAGLMTLLARKKKKQSLAQKALSTLSNAVIAGGLGAGAATLLGKGKEQLETALPTEDVDPASSALTSPLGLTLSGILGTAYGGLKGKNLQTERAAQELKNYFASLKPNISVPGSSGRTVLKPNRLFDDLKAIFSKEQPDMGMAKARLADYFSPTNPEYSANVRNLKGGFSTDKELFKFLRYLNVERPGALEWLKGNMERLVDARKVMGTPLGRFSRLRGGALGLAAGVAAPLAINAANKFLENRNK